MNIPYLLEPSVPPELTLEAAIALSQAISLRRIAEALGSMDDIERERRADEVRGSK